ncbi:homoserine dehydrogenase [Macrococcoides caseolyticum]|uniref:homoserine dehydrogenase n=1 Tax=Macrococcoides caseolyticum TaxID=69966 RepID=UPI002D8106F1|nr:homoserine dehydrogenase [Macrococcus caseolyticus]MCE4957188.1 homoserine dehydrogenase [Macrococcus caseolyticus]
MKNLKIGLLGLGTVGSGVVRIIEENKVQIKEKLNTNIVIHAIGVKNINKQREIDVSNYHLTDDLNEVIQSDIDILIEVMGGIEETYPLITQALKNKIHVITANKDMLAEHLEELENLSRTYGVSLKYEAAVAGGIPIINALNYGLNANGITHFMGIFNGTSNFILSQMSNENKTYEEALQLATDLGFAEADPSADVDGYDAQRKVVIMSYLAFNQFNKRNDCTVEGIRDVRLSHIELAKQLGYRIKLIGNGLFDGHNVQLSVAPMAIPMSHQLAHVENEYNAIYIDGNAVGDTMFYGKGAGSLATGSAVVSDLLHIIEKFDTDTHNLPLHLEVVTPIKHNSFYHQLLMIDLYADTDIKSVLAPFENMVYKVMDGVLAVELRNSSQDAVRNVEQHLIQLNVNYKIYRIEGVES